VLDLGECNVLLKRGCNWNEYTVINIVTTEKRLLIDLIYNMIFFFFFFFPWLHSPAYALASSTKSG
jgi:hypothetical protein